MPLQRVAARLALARIVVAPLSCSRDDDVAVGHHLHALEQIPRADRDRAGLLTRRDAAADTEIQVRSRESQLVGFAPRAARCPARASCSSCRRRPGSGPECGPDPLADHRVHCLSPVAGRGQRRQPPFLAAPWKRIRRINNGSSAVMAAVSRRFQNRGGRWGQASSQPWHQRARVTSADADAWIFPTRSLRYLHRGRIGEGDAKGL